MIKQDHPFSQKDDIEKDFIRIKKAINSAPFLVELEFEKDFIIYTNATEEAISTNLMKNDDQNNENL
jgi:hypothetical protein